MESDIPATGGGMTGAAAGLEIYVHIPFCVKKCAYCDFLSGPAPLPLQRQYVSALCCEIQAAAEAARETAAETGEPAIESARPAAGPVTSIFIGGGTPSILPEDLPEQILEKIKQTFTVAPDAEITIEANPGTLSKEKLISYRKSGINRLSIGLQSPKDRELAILGRIHTWKDFEFGYDAARSAGFDNINIDLMFAIPRQTPAVWRENLETVAAFSPEHISAYSLIIEEGTPFAEQELDLPDEDEEYAMYEDTYRILREAGYHQYEISNYARPGRECRHNTGYWTRADYLGFGIGAASLYQETRFRNTRNLQVYLDTFSDRPDKNLLQKVRRDRQVLSRQDSMAEYMFLGLRLRQGISREGFRKAFGRELEEVYGPVLKKYLNMSLLEEKDGWIRLTRPGIHVSNTIMSDFL